MIARGLMRCICDRCGDNEVVAEQAGLPLGWELMRRVDAGGSLREHLLCPACAESWAAESAPCHERFSAWMAAGAAGAGEAV